MTSFTLEKKSPQNYALFEDYTNYVKVVWNT